MTTPKVLQISARDRRDFCRSRLENAKAFIGAGISLIPLLMDGTKRPGIPGKVIRDQSGRAVEQDFSKPMSGWNLYSERLATTAELESWFDRPAGVGAVCGRISGGLEVLDFDIDAENVFPAWSKIVDSVLCRLPVVETPRGGFHVYFRSDSGSGNQKLAKTKEPNENGKHQTIIETRGEGGQVATVLSDPGAHAENFEWIQAAGPVLPEIPKISSGDRDRLLDAAKSFDRSGHSAEMDRRLELSKTRAPSRSDTPWAEFNRASLDEWRHWLESAGWSTADGKNWLRPGATSKSRSAFIGQADTGEHYLVAVSPSAGLPHMKRQRLTSVINHLYFNGDFEKTRHFLRKEGFGNYGF